MLVPSVLWRCWLGGRKGNRPVKTEWWGVGMVIRLERGADLHVAQLMPLPLTISCFSKIQIGFAFLVPAHLGSPGQRAVKRVCVWGVHRAESFKNSCYWYVYVRLSCHHIQPVYCVRCWWCVRITPTCIWCWNLSVAARCFHTCAG